MSTEVATATKETAQSLVSRMAARFGVDPNKMLATLKATAFKGDVSNEQMMALLVVAEQYKLNPWVKEIYAFPDKNNGIVPVVGVDGWMRILNENPQFDGVEFLDGPTDGKGIPEWIECTIHRKDRAHPTAVREYMAECRRDTGPWKSHPRRMLRHKSLIQSARVAMSFGGIHDEDEAQRIIEGEVMTGQESPGIATINKSIGRGKTVAIEGHSERVESDVAAAIPISDGLMVTAIAVLAGHTDADEMGVWADGLADSVRNDERFGAAYRKQLDAIKLKGK